MHGLIFDKHMTTGSINHVAALITADFFLEEETAQRQATLLVSDAASLGQKDVVTSDTPRLWGDHVRSKLCRPSPFPSSAYTATTIQNSHLSDALLNNHSSALADALPAHLGYEPHSREAP